MPAAQAIGYLSAIGRDYVLHYNKILVHRRRISKEDALTEGGLNSDYYYLSKDRNKTGIFRKSNTA